VSADLLRTPLHDRHVAAGAKLVPFAGWEMPVEYAGVKDEHLAVRSGVGIFDVSHMGQIRTHGPDATTLLQRLLSNDVTRIPLHGAQYAMLCREDGGVLDDVFTYHLAEQTYLTVTNAANHAKDVAWFRRHAEGLDVHVDDIIDHYAMVAVQGPGARDLVTRVAGHELPGRMRIARVHIGEGTGPDAVDAMVAGTGYTGEDGVELLLPPEVAGAVWDDLVAGGAVPVGLGARDTLRLEACFHLYGNDLSEDRDPIGAGLGWACKEDTGFIGADAIAAARETLAADGGTGPDRTRLVPFRFVGRGIPRPGNPVVGGGIVTSGTYSPSLGIGIGMAYVPGDKAEPGTPLQIDVRGRVRDAEVAERPLYPAA